MASFQEHLRQSKRNLIFLSKINGDISDCLDWQVTTCFYSGLHLLNAYLAEKQNLHYNRHSDVESALNPKSQFSTVKLGDADFQNYQRLRNLSRRSRYLCTEGGDHGVPAQATAEKHLSRAIISLDLLMRMFVKFYPGESFDKTIISCPTLLGEPLIYFEVATLRVPEKPIPTLKT